MAPLFSTFSVASANLYKADIYSVKSIVFNQSASDLTSLTTYNFSNIDFGEEHPDRLVVICVTGSDGGNGTQITSATIGGVAATIHVNTAQGGATSAYIGIISALVPRGTTGAVSITFNTSKNRCYIGCYSLYNLDNLTPVGTSNPAWATSTNITVTSSAANTGFCIACSATRTASTYTNTGAIEDFDISPTTALSFTGATATVSGSIVFTATSSGSIGAAAASWS